MSDQGAGRRHRIAAQQTEDGHPGGSCLRGQQAGGAEGGQRGHDHRIAEAHQVAEGVDPVASARLDQRREHLQDIVSQVQAARDLVDTRGAIGAGDGAGEHVGVAARGARAILGGDVAPQVLDEGGGGLDERGKIAGQRIAEPLVARRVDVRGGAEQGQGFTVETGELQVVGPGSFPAKVGELVLVGHVSRELVERYGTARSVGHRAL